MQPDDEVYTVKARAPRPTRTLRYSPLVQHFIKLKRFSSGNLVPNLRMALTDAEGQVEAMHRKHSKLPQRIAQAKKFSQDLLAEYKSNDEALRREEKALLQRSKKAEQALYERREEVLKKSPHDFANYLVCLRSQQGIEKQH